MGSLKILSVNFQSLRDSDKRQNVFNLHKTKIVAYTTYKIHVLIILVIFRTMLDPYGDH